MSSNSIDKKQDTPELGTEIAPEIVTKSVTDSPSVKEDSNIYDILLSKYMSVWLWSIIFGAMTGNVFTYATYRPYDGGITSIRLVVLILITVGMVATFTAWLSLYKGMAYYLIPKFLLGEEPAAKDFAITLKTSFLMTIFATFIRLTLAVFDTFLSSRF